MKCFHWSEFANFTIFEPKKGVLKIFEQVKIVKASAGFEHMTYRFVVQVLTHWALLLDNDFEKEQIYKIIDFIDHFKRKYVTIWRCPKPR